MIWITVPLFVSIFFSDGYNNFQVPIDSLIKGISDVAKSNSKTQSKRNEKSKKPLLRGFKCGECDKILATKSSLGQHSKDTHSGNYYFCSDCSVGSNSVVGRFKYVYNLETHTRDKHNRDAIEDEKKPHKMNTAMTEANKRTFC